MMFPSLRGGKQSPGFIEGLYGEVNDVISAYDYLAQQTFIDTTRIFLGGHSTGGTLALLVSEATDKFNAVFSLGPIAYPEKYGKNYFLFDTDNQKEWELRSPIHFLNFIKSPTFVFEGTIGSNNITSLRKMKKENKNVMIKFFEIDIADHYSIIVPITELIAKKIIMDKNVNKRIGFNRDELIFNKTN